MVVAKQILASLGDELPSDERIPSSLVFWPDDLGIPGSVGAQNDLRYAVFPGARRLAIKDGRHIDVYDTGDHRIFGVAQSQSTDQTLTFTSQTGLVRIADLPRIDS